MAETKAKNDAAPKAERKKPVRKAPVQKDYSSKLDWLRAMTEYEEKQAEVTNAGKLARLEKRIASKNEAIKALADEQAKLVAERDALKGIEQVPADVGTEATEA